MSNSFLRSIPKGSNPRTILFLLYVNDLPNCLKSATASMFVYDTNLTASGNTSPELYNKLDNDLENIHHTLKNKCVNITRFFCPLNNTGYITHQRVI